MCHPLPAILELSLHTVWRCATRGAACAHWASIVRGSGLLRVAAASLAHTLSICTSRLQCIAHVIASLAHTLGICTSRLKCIAIVIA